MNATSRSRAEAEGAASHVLVWDAPVRLFHWLLVLSFAGAYLTAESESWRLLHVTLGYTLGGLVMFRILWGLVGTRYARFGAFVRAPSAGLRYLRDLWQRRPQHFLGHNPAGAWAILSLLALSLLVTVSGWALYSDIGGGWVEEAHEVIANLMLALAILHVAGVALSSWLHKENLIGAMVTGRKPGAAGQGINSALGSVAAIMLVAVLGFWWLQWHSAPAPEASQQHATIKDRPDE